MMKYSEGGVEWDEEHHREHPLTAGLRRPGQGQQTVFVFQQIWYQGSCSPHKPPYIPPLHTYTTPSTSLLAKHPLQPGDPSPPTSLTKYSTLQCSSPPTRSEDNWGEFPQTRRRAWWCHPPGAQSLCLHSQSPEGPCAVEAVMPCSCANDAPSQKLLWLQTSGADVPHHEYPVETNTGRALAHSQPTPGPPSVCLPASTAGPSLRAPGPAGQQCEDYIFWLQHQAGSIGWEADGEAGWSPPYVLDYWLPDWQTCAPAELCYRQGGQQHWGSTGGCSLPLPLPLHPDLSYRSESCQSSLMTLP